VVLINTNDHEPIHVHVRHLANDVHFRVFVDDLKVDYITSNQLNSRDEKAVLKLIEQNKEFIKERWYEIQKDQ